MIRKISYCWWCGNECQIRSSKQALSKWADAQFTCHNHPNGIYIVFDGNIDSSSLIVNWITVKFQSNKFTISGNPDMFTKVYFDKNDKFNISPLYRMKPEIFFSQSIEKSMKIFDLIAFS